MGCACQQGLTGVKAGARVVVTAPNGCASSLNKPLYSSLVFWNGDSEVKWSDGSSENPICLPNLRYGEGYLTTELVATTNSGCVYRIPVSAVELTLCPETEGGDPVLITVLAIQNQP